MTPDRDHLFLGIHSAATVLRAGPVGVAYAPECAPVVIVSNNPKYETVTEIRDGRPETVVVETGRGPVLGFAFTPLGLETDVHVHPQWCAYATGAIGGIWFMRQVPVINSRRFNYTFALGGGVLWEYRPRRWVQLGYKFHHLSNMGTASSNPGLDANLFYIGWQRLFGKSS